ncbi:MAG: efflux RND transporter periplasmic adaptor subunit [Alphaproteobacteria bacterium]
MNARKFRTATLPGAAIFVAGALLTVPAPAQTPELSGPAQALDTNSNGLIERAEALGPAATNFDTIDLDKSDTLDGDELRHFFAGGPRPEPKAAAARTPAEPLAGPAVAMDANRNGTIEKNEAQGPAASNFDTIDLDKSGALDGSELRYFFRGGERPSGPAKNDNADAKPSGGVTGGPPPARVVLDEVVEERIGQTTPVVGRIVAQQSGPIAARIGGAVVEMRVDVGDRVATGDVLAQIDRERMQLERDRYAAIVSQQRAKLTAERADLEQTQNELDRLEGIRKSAAFSQARFEDAVQAVASQTGSVAETRAQLAQAQAQLKRADRDLTDTEIRAPYPGVISETHTEIGAYLSIGNPVATIINDLNLEVEADVPSARVASLSSGDAVNIRIAKGRTIPARLRAVVPSENPRTRTRPVRFTADFAGLDTPLANNQSVTVLLPVGGSRNAVTVSKDAVTQRNGQNMVFVSNNGRAQPRPVTTGEATGSRLVVISGLKAGDLVVVRGNERLRPGQRLQDVGAGGTATNGSGGG